MFFLVTCSIQWSPPHLFIPFSLKRHLRDLDGRLLKLSRYMWQGTHLQDMTRMSHIYFTHLRPKKWTVVSRKSWPVWCFRGPFFWEGMKIIGDFFVLQGETFSKARCSVWTLFDTYSSNRKCSQWGWKMSPKMIKRNQKGTNRPVGMGVACNSAIWLI